MTRLEMREAEALAEEALAQMAKRVDVVALMKKEYLCSDQTAQKIVRRAEKRLIEVIDMSVPQRQARYQARLEALYRQCMKHKKFATAERVLFQIAKAEGVAGATKIQAVSPTIKDDMDNRSEQELDHYLEHGCWPEELQTTNQLTTSVVLSEVANDPLKGLH